MSRPIMLPRQDVRRFEAALYILRKKAENAARQSPDTPLYMCSLSSRVINYKGMLTCPGLARYYPDLLEDRLACSFSSSHFLGGHRGT